MIDLSMFEKIEISQRPKSKIREKMTVRLGGIRKGETKVRRIIVSADIVEQMCWLDNERLDLFRMGKTFALKMNKVGLLRACKLSKTSRAMAITSVEAAGYIKEITQTDEFDARVEDEVLFFKPRIS